MWQDNSAVPPCQASVRHQGNYRRLTEGGTPRGFDRSIGSRCWPLRSRCGGPPGGALGGTTTSVAWHASVSVVVLLCRWSGNGPLVVLDVSPVLVRVARGLALSLWWQWWRRAVVASAPASTGPWVVPVGVRQGVELAAFVVGGAFRAAGGLFLFHRRFDGSHRLRRCPAPDSRRFRGCQAASRGEAGDEQGCRQDAERDRCFRAACPHFDGVFCGGCRSCSCSCCSLVQR